MKISTFWSNWIRSYRAIEFTTIWRGTPKSNGPLSLEMRNICSHWPLKKAWISISRQLLPAKIFKSTKILSCVNYFTQKTNTFISWRIHKNHLSMRRIRCGNPFQSMFGCFGILGSKVRPFSLKPAFRIWRQQPRAQVSSFEKWMIAIYKHTFPKICWPGSRIQWMGPKYSPICKLRVISIVWLSSITTEVSTSMQLR